MAVEYSKRKKVFISYSHQDAGWLARLRIHLKPLEREYEIDVWDDTKIKPGSRWKEEIEKAIGSAKVVVLLVSADFLASDFIATDELPPLLSAAEKEGAVIIPVIISPSRFSRTKSINKFKSQNDPCEPLISMTKSEQETVLVKLTEAIESSLNAFDSCPTGTLKERPVPLKTEDQRRQFLSRQQVGQVSTMKKKSIPLKTSSKLFLALIGVMITLTVVYWQLIREPAPNQPSDANGVANSNTSKVDPDPPNTAIVDYFDKGLKEFSQKNYIFAIDLFTRAIEHNVRLSEAYHYRGASKYELKNYRDALEDCKESIKHGSMNPWTYNLCGMCNQALRLYEESIKYFDDAIKINPNFGQIYLNRAISKEKLNGRPGGSSDRRKAADLDH